MKPSTVFLLATPVIAGIGYGLSDLVATRLSGRLEWPERAPVVANPARAFRYGTHAVSAGAVDWQSTHDEDEVYWVIRGRAILRLEGRNLSVLPGSVIYVKAGEQHRFYDVEEDLAAITFTPRESR